MTANQERIISFLSESAQLTGEQALHRFAALLGYNVVFNPVDSHSEWFLMEHPALKSSDEAIMAIKYDEDLDQSTSVTQLRKRYEEITTQRDVFGLFVVHLYAFVGKGRVVIFRAFGGHRDERLDISADSVNRISLYADSLMSLHYKALELREDAFGQLEIGNIDGLFRRELSSHFNRMVHLYSKRIAEITVSDDEFEAAPISLLPRFIQEKLRNLPLEQKVLNPHFKTAVGSIVDTIVLRVLLRRFLEAYHGLEPFTKEDDFTDLGFGQGEGQMEEVLKYLAEIKYQTSVPENRLKKALETHGPEQLKLFDASTSTVEIRRQDQIATIYKRLRRQFELAYGGDLFDSDVATAANLVENGINKKHPDLLLRLWADTSSELYNFRYEDLPPEQIQEHYENSMSHSLQLSVVDGKNVVVEYSGDLQEQKHRGAYYTNNQLVSYIVEKTVAKELQVRRARLEKLIAEGESEEVLFSAIKDIGSIRVIDFTCGGGSFLRGAFRYLSSRREDVVRTLLNIKDGGLLDMVFQAFPHFDPSDEGQGLWERHILLEMIYGIDIDYKALIISTQTLTLSALKNWQVGQNFPKLIGLTLMHQNGLIFPVSPTKRETFTEYKEQIKNLIELRRSIVKAQSPKESKSLFNQLLRARKAIQIELGQSLRSTLGIYQDAMIPESIEINFPEVFFNDDGTLKKEPGFDVCLGNPPWEDWKPNSDEFFEEISPGFRQLASQRKPQAMQAIFGKMPYVKERWDWLGEYYEAGSSYFLSSGHLHHQRTKVGGRYTASDINLYKVSLERAYQVLKVNGLCGFLVPANAYIDQGSTGLRKLLFEKTMLSEIASFENREAIFAEVDNRTKFSILIFQKGGKTENFKAFFYRKQVQDLQDPNLFMTIPIETVKALAPDTWSVMEFREQREVDILTKLTSWPFLGEHIPGKWNIRFISEFHMTNDRQYFLPKGKGKTLFEGKMIEQFTHLFAEPRYSVSRSGEKRLLDKEVKRAEKAAREATGLPTKKAVRAVGGIRRLQDMVCPHSQFYRIAYRAVASATNRRTFISTILPKGVYLGHSLNATIPYSWVVEQGALKTHNNYTVRQLLVVTSFFNSLTVDFIVRRKTDKNVSMFLVYQLPIPRLMEEDRFFDDICRRSALLICTTPEFDELAEEAGIRHGVTDPELRQLIQNQIDAYVAKIYGVSREEFLYILTSFKTPKHKENAEKIAQGVIEQFDILNERGELEWPL